MHSLGHIIFHLLFDTTLPHSLVHLLSAMEKKAREVYITKAHRQGNISLSTSPASTVQKRVHNSTYYQYQYPSVI